MAKAKSKFTVAENLEILRECREHQKFVLANPTLDANGKAIPNPLADEFYLAGVHAAKALQQ